jgi:hypothetical protein
VTAANSTHREHDVDSAVQHEVYLRLAVSAPLGAKDGRANFIDGELVTVSEMFHQFVGETVDIRSFITDR